MKAPEGLETLLDYGIIQEVVRPLMSGKEAQVYVVVAGGETCVAKVYKEATQRTFRQRADYTEGRRTRNSRDQRAITKRTRHGRKKDEDAWRSAEVDMLYRLRDAGVRVPEPINFVEGVLVMELVKDADGDPAPRLGDQAFSAEEARRIYEQLLRDAIRMLCAGVIHGDLSEFNVLVGVEGPVVIDFPQAVDPTQNRNGEKLFLRDIENLHRFLARCAPGDPIRPYGEEIWKLYQANRLDPETQLRGDYRAPQGKADTREVMALIEDAQSERARRPSAGGPRKRGRSNDAQDGGLEEFDDLEADPTEGDPRARVEAPSATPPPLRRVVDFSAEASRRPSRGPRPKNGAGDRSSPNRSRRASSSASATGPSSADSARPSSPPSSSARGSGAPASTARPANPKHRRRRSRTASDASAPSPPALAGHEPNGRVADGLVTPGGEGTSPRKRRRRGRRRPSDSPARNGKSPTQNGAAEARGAAGRGPAKAGAKATDAPRKTPRVARPTSEKDGPPRPRRRRSRRRSAPE